MSASFVKSVTTVFTSGDDSDTSIENELNVLVKQAETIGIFSGMILLNNMLVTLVTWSLAAAYERTECVSCKYNALNDSSRT